MTILSSITLIDGICFNYVVPAAKAFLCKFFAVFQGASRHFC
ncbi:hypothetical protein C4J84_2793 [Pseudomonas sp. R11-23-07]|nr:hypothetical protein C4J90_2983 [Pseudomonas sp. R2-60-08W]AZF58668.1 hypothetical protein C4J84_2793 [Pseudomonas sp. R11-23-07]